MTLHECVIANLRHAWGGRRYAWMASGFWDCQRFFGCAAIGAAAFGEEATTGGADLATGAGVVFVSEFLRPSEVTGTLHEAS